MDGNNFVAKHGISWRKFSGFICIYLDIWMEIQVE